VRAPDPRDQIAAAVPLAASSKVAREFLVAQLGSSDVELRLAAIPALPALPDRREHLDALARDPDARIRAAAIALSPRIAGGGAIELIEIAAADADADVRRAAAQALGAWAPARVMIDERAFAVLDRLLADKTLPVRLVAASALPAVRRAASIDPLRKLASSANDPFVGLRAALALHTLHHTDEAVRTIERALKSSALDVRRAALGAAGEIDAAGLPLLTRALDDPMPRVQLDAALLLAARGELPRARPRLVAALGDAHSIDERIEAAEGLAREKDPSGLQALAELVRSSDVNARRRAVRALAPLPGPIATRALLGCLTDVDAPTRLSAADALLSRTLPRPPARA
jgi:HEAT repeat protein